MINVDKQKKNKKKTAYKDSRKNELKIFVKTTGNLGN